MACAHAENGVSKLHCRVCAAITAACLTAGFFLALAHPLWPALAVSAFLGVVPLFAWRPWLGILAVPALLPLLNFAPWTGWLIVEEFDLLVLAVLAGGYFSIWRSGSDLRYARALAWLATFAVCLIGWGMADL